MKEKTTLTSQKKKPKLTLLHYATGASADTTENGQSTIRRSLRKQPSNNGQNVDESKLNL